MTRFLRLGLFLAVILICLTNISHAQLTRQQAINKVLNQIVVSDTGHNEVFASFNQFNYLDSLHLNYDTSLLCPYNYAWVFFIDDHPYTNWAHPCRYIFVDSITANFQIVNENQFPFCFRDPYCNEFEVVNEAYEFPQASFPLNQNYQQPNIVPNPNLYAVLIVTQDAKRYPQNMPNRFWNDASLIYNTLKEVYGYTDENIYVHYFDGDSPRNGSDFDVPSGDDHIDYEASKDRILETFDNLAGNSISDPNILALSPSDQLFVFVDGHGIADDGESAIYCVHPESEVIPQDELALSLEEIDCAQMTFLFQICNSGGFAYEFTDYNTYANVTCKNRVIHTSTSIDYPSTAKIYLTNKAFTEFTFYWAAAVRGFYPVIESPWDNSHATGLFPFDIFHPDNNHPGDYDPDLNDDGFIQMEEAFLYADDMDAWSPQGYNNYLPPINETYEEPVNIDRIGYDEAGLHYNNLITLYGLAGGVGDGDDAILLPNRNYMAGNIITVEDNTYLAVEENSNFYMTGSETKINVETAGSVDFYDHVSVNSAKIDVDGELQIHDYVTIDNDEINVDGKLVIDSYVTISNGEINIDGELDVGSYDIFTNLSLNLNNSEMQTTFNQSTFNNSTLHNYGDYLEIGYSDFIECNSTHSHRGNVNVFHTVFNHTGLYLENTENNNNNVSVTYCDFINGSYTMNAVDVWNYRNFLLGYNTVDGYFNGIEVGQSGMGSTTNNNILYNEIFNCSTSGMVVFNSTASIISNHIHDNLSGLCIYNNGNVDLYGNPGAQSYDEMNLIKDNTLYELYASAGSFPWYFRYNAIIDDDNAGNPNDPLVYAEPPGGSIMFDVKYNCWTEGEFFLPL